MKSLTKLAFIGLTSLTLTGCAEMLDYLDERGKGVDSYLFEAGYTNPRTYAYSIDGKGTYTKAQQAYFEDAWFAYEENNHHADTVALLVSNLPIRDQLAVLEMVQNTERSDIKRGSVRYWIFHNERAAGLPFTFPQR